MEYGNKPQIKEEEAIVLDFLQNGYSNDSRPSHMKTPIAQALGKNHFVLLELVPKKGIFLQPYENVYIGEGKREKIHHISGKINLDKLTSTAQSELNYVIKDIVEKEEQKFVEFFNNCGPLSTRMHQLELLPGLGKKHMWEILDERKVEPFKSYKDIKDRVKLMPEPTKLIIKRILSEISGKEKHMVFVK